MEYMKAEEWSYFKNEKTNNKWSYFRNEKTKSKKVLEFAQI